MAWMIIIGALLCIIAVWLFVIAATMQDDECDWDSYVDEEMKEDIRKMMNELGGDEEE